MEMLTIFSISMDHHWHVRTAPRTYISNYRIDELEICFQHSWHLDSQQHPFPRQNMAMHNLFHHLFQFHRKSTSFPFIKTIYSG